MPQSRANLSRAYDDIKANLTKVVIDQYKQERAVYRQLFNIETTDKSMIWHDSFVGLGMLQKKEELAAGATDEVRQGYAKQYTPYTYSLLVEFSEEAMEDDRLGILKKALAALGTSAVATEDTLAVGILNNAFTTTGPDGKVLCATDHPLIKTGGTAKNRPTNGMDFSHTALGLAMVDWYDDQKDDNGQKLTIDPKYLVYPASIFVDVAEVLKSTDRPDTANRATNVMREFNLERVMWRRLTDTDAWGLLAGKGQHSLTVVVRKPFHTTHGTDDKMGKVWTRGRFRRDQGFTDWRGVYMSPGQ